MTLTIEERIEIILLCGQIGATNRSVAESFNSSHEGVNIGHTTVGRLLTKFKETGSVRKLRLGSQADINTKVKDIDFSKKRVSCCATYWNKQRNKILE